MKKIIRTSTIPDSLYGLLNGQLKHINQYFEVVVVSGPGEYLNKVGEREGVRVVPVDMQRRISLFKDLVSLIKLIRCFRKEKPIIVHSITPKAGLLSMCAAYIAHVPIRMHTFTGLVFPSKVGLLRRLLMVMDYLLCKFATNIYPEGEGVKADLIKHGITKKPLKVLANGNVNGIDINHFNPDLYSELDKIGFRKSLGLLANDFIFIFVGRLVGDKGINELVTAFSKIKTIYPNVKLLLVGPFEEDLDPLKSETLAEIESNDAILTTGFQEDVRPYFALANAFVFPSYREGFPNVVLQAGSMGLPSIVTDINGSNEIIKDGYNGLIVKVKDSLALYQAMEKLIDDAALTTHLKSNIRYAIVSSFEQSVVWKAIIQEYKSLLKNV